jgi:hypothetical protein
MSIRESLGSCYAVRDARLGQMGEMLEMTGTLSSLPQGSSGDAELQAAVLRCLDCLNVDLCKNWLGTAAQGSSAPSFCANAGRFNRPRSR